MRDPVVAVSERVTLRRWDRSDAKALFEICRHDDVARMYGSRPRSVREVRTLITDFNGREEGLGVTTWAVALRASGALIGWCGYARTNKGWLSANVVEIGWLLDFDRWGQGLATEAARAALTIGEVRLEPTRIVSTCREDNLRSERVMERIGLRRVGVIAGGDQRTTVYRRL